LESLSTLALSPLADLASAAVADTRGGSRGGGLDIHRRVGWELLAAGTNVAACRCLPRRPDAVVFIALVDVVLAVDGRSAFSEQTRDALEPAGEHPAVASPLLAGERLGSGGVARALGPLGGRRLLET
jgi:hypothetical protein